MVTQPFKVLVVDDTDAQRYAVAHTLRGQGFAVEQASTGAEAIEAAKSKPDLILLDIVLPDINGFEVCRRLKADAATAEIPVIQISANFVDPEHRVQGFHGGADDYIAQPITPEELVAKIGVWARIRRAEEELRLKNAQLEATNAQLARDIEGRQHTEEALRKSEQRLRFHMENTPLAIIEWGADFRLTRWSGEAERIFGWRADEVLGKRMKEFRWVYEEDIDRVNEVSEGLRTGTCPRSVSSNRNYRKDGSVVYCEWYNSSLVDDSGRLVSIMALVLDVTERKRTQEALVRSEKLASVGRMAASVAHEINNPLEAVTNLVFLAQNQKNCPKAIHEYLSTASSELKRISHVTRQVLGFYRGSAAAESICVQSVLDDATELFGSRITARGINVEKQYGKQIQIRAVAGELRQIFSNLLANSLEALSPEGTIKIRVSESKLEGEPGVRITLSDNGSGIKRAAAPHIFEPLFTTKEKIGTGLGLWITKQLIEKHGGSIRFRTSTEGKQRGTTFSIVLPTNMQEADTRAAD